MTAAARPGVVLAAAVLVCAVVVGGAMALSGPLASALGGWSPAAQEAIFALLLYGILAVAAVIGRRLAGGLSEAGPGDARWAGLGLAIGVGGLSLALADAWLAGSVSRGSTVPGFGMLLFGTIVVLGQSASEELFFRGWVQPVLARAWGPVAAIAVTALAFAGLHVAGGARAPLTLVNLALGGALFGLLAWRSGGLLAPIAAHAGWNWAEAILFGLDPNPGTGSFGALRDLDLAGAARWGGSAEGLNASIAMTIVLAALILPLSMRLLSTRRQHSPQVEGSKN